VQLRPVERPVAGLVLGHGAGGGVEAPDLLAAAEAANEVRVAAALAEQPYRVAGRRSSAPARQLDAAWAAVVEQLRSDAFTGLPMQGDRDPFGMPSAGPGRTVTEVPGNHSLRDTDALRDAVSAWLPDVLSG
jgi:predicted alpha/beta-hydrolase family hydrolase